MYIIDVVAALWLKENGVFLAQRALGDSLAGLWEFPGGKVEPGETHQQALEREMYEEFHLLVSCGEFFKKTEWQGPTGRIVRLHAYYIHCQLEQPIKLQAHDAYQWWDLSLPLTLPLAPADVPIAEQLVLHIK